MLATLLLVQTGLFTTYRKSSMVCLLVAQSLWWPGVEAGDKLEADSSPFPTLQTSRHEPCSVVVKASFLKITNHGKAPPLRSDSSQLCTYSIVMKVVAFDLK